MAANSIADVTETAILKLVFQAVAWTDYAINHTTTPQTQIGVSLHTNDPGEAGDATTNEITTGAYAGYTRVNVARTTGGWNVTGTAPTVASPVATISFPAGTGGTGASASYFATAKSNATPPTGAQALLWTGSVTPPISCGNGVTPQLSTSSTIALD